MAISGLGDNYNNVYESDYAAQKTAASKKVEPKAAVPAQASPLKFYIFPFLHIFFQQFCAPVSLITHLAEKL